MAAVTPLPGNQCIGSDDTGTAIYQLKCVRGQDAQGDDIVTCATWRKFRVQCPKLNQQCSTLSEAYVAAITVCNQRLF